MSKHESIPYSLGMNDSFSFGCQFESIENVALGSGWDADRSGILSREKWAKVSINCVSWSKPRLPPCPPCIKTAVLLLAKGQPAFLQIWLRVARGKVIYLQPKCSIYHCSWWALLSIWSPDRAQRWWMIFRDVTKAKGQSGFCHPNIIQMLQSYYVHMNH